MSFYLATVGELAIIEAFVFFIWYKVMLSAVEGNDGTLSQKKLLMTSVGLVLSSLAVFGIMGLRLYELQYGLTTLWPISVLYVMLATGNFILMISAALGKRTNLLKWFLLFTFVWTAFVLFVSI